MSDRITLRLGRGDMNTFRTDDVAGERVRVHVAGRHPAALCPSCARPSLDTNGTGWRDVIDVVRTVVIVLSICVRRFWCVYDDCPQRTFDERFEGIDRGGASHRALRFFADLARGRATRAVARDLSVPEHYLRLAVGKARKRASARRAGRLGAHLAIDECSIKKRHVYATVFSDPGRGVVIDLAPGRDGAAVWAFASLYTHTERARVRVVTIDCHAPYRYMVRIAFPHALLVADAFHLHRRVLSALADVRKAASRRLRRANPDLAAELKQARYALLRARDDVQRDTTARGERDRRAVYNAVHIDNDLALAYELKEAFRAAMAVGRSGDVKAFLACLDLFDAWCRDSGVRAFVTLAKTFRAWREEIVNYARSGGATNAMAEALNHQIKNQKRQAHGYATWQGFRTQMIWTFGEAVNPETGEIKTLRSVPRGQGANYAQPQFT